MPERILKLPAVKQVTTLSRTTIYQWIKDGTFPRPIPLGAKAVGWVESEIDAWIAARQAERGAALGATAKGEVHEVQQNKAA